MTDDLQPTCYNILPGGVVDAATYEAIETALDRAEAPMCQDNKWLTLPERIAALAAERDAARRDRAPGVWTCPASTAVDDASAETVLAALRLCASSWVADARIVGNVRAGDIVRAINDIEVTIGGTSRRIRDLEASLKKRNEAFHRIVYDERTSSFAGNPMNWPAVIAYEALGGTVRDYQRGAHLDLEGEICLFNDMRVPDRFPVLRIRQITAVPLLKRDEAEVEEIVRLSAKSDNPILQQIHAMITSSEIDQTTWDAISVLTHL